MQELILSVLSLIILVPLIYFLPLGLTNKGKAFIVGAAFLLANIGLLTQHILPTWLIWTILALLVFLVAYVMQNRMSEVLFAGMSEDSGTKDSLYDQNLDAVDERDRFYKRYDSYREESVPASGTMEDIRTASLPELEEEDSAASDEHPREESAEMEEIALKESDDQLIIEKSEALGELPGQDLAETPEDEQLLEPGEGRDEDAAGEPSYLGRIERLMEDDDTEAEETVELTAIQEESMVEDLSTEELQEAASPAESPELEETGDLSGELFGAMDEYASESEMLHEVEEEDTHLPEENEIFIQEDEAKDGGDEQQADEEIAEIADLPVDEEEWQASVSELFGETVLQVEEEQLQEQPDGGDTELEILIGEEEEVLHDEPAQEAHPQQLPTEDTNLEDGDEEEAALEEQRHALQQQMLHLLASQLELQRDRLPAHQYESLIKEHLVDDLPPQDYYTFASMLIEHYIRNKELGKLEELLWNLREKFTEFPVIMMEIQYLYEQYCKNIL